MTFGRRSIASLADGRKGHFATPRNAVLFAMPQHTSLDNFADRLVQLSDDRGISPVLTLQSGLSLHPRFFGHLAERITAQTGRPMRFDLVVNPYGPLASARRWRALREVAKLSAEMPPEASVSIGVTVGRPAGKRRPLVIGIASDSVDLPEWACRISVCTRPTDSDAVQIIAA